MINLFDAAAALMAATLKSHASVAITYRRGPQSVALRASVGRNPTEADSREGATIEAEARDFLITAADLILGGGRVEPKVDDRIEMTLGDTVATFAVFRPLSQSSGGVDQLDPHFRYSDRGGAILRVHTKRVSASV
jgi:hypothetical protein